jgi:dihydrofolate reductase
MSVLSIIIIWCDVSFEKDESYQSMKNEFNEATTATMKKPFDPIDMMILNEGKEELRSNNVPLITVRTADDAMREIKEHKDKKIFIISSGTVARYLVPEIVRQYPYVRDFYVYTHNIALHVEWADQYPPKMLKMFNFHTTLLLRLTRDIAGHFIERGNMFLSDDAPQNALSLFKHARKLEIGANVREKIKPSLNSTEPNYSQPDFRDNLDQLEGSNGLICQAEAAVHAQGLSLEND